MAFPGSPSQRPQVGGGDDDYHDVVANLHNLRGPTAYVMEQLGERPADAGRRARVAVPIIINQDTLDKPELLADVFTEFLRTNDRNARRVAAVVDLWRNRTGYSPCVRTTYFHLNIPYRCDIFHVDGRDGPWINIKLCTDGFVFTPQRQRDRVARHNDDRWVAMAPRKIIEKFATLFDAFDKTVYTKAKVWVNEHVEKVRRYGGTTGHRS
jgi:hypothetical protein